MLFTFPILGFMLGAVYSLFELSCMGRCLLMRFTFAEKGVLSDSFLISDGIISELTLPLQRFSIFGISLGERLGIFNHSSWLGV